MTTAAASDRAAKIEWLRNDTPAWARHLAKIRDKAGRVVPMEMNAGQLVLDGKLVAQREAGRSQRAIALKARQVGVSTYAQARLVKGGTLTANFDGMCLAHDRETGAKLWKIGDRMYRNLPHERDLRPPMRNFQRARFMLWGEEQPDGTLYPDSSYLVDTAGESEAGRGGTYTAIHASEFAFWPNPVEKLTSIQSAVPDDDPNTFIIIESTANGTNYFKDVWDDAVAGRNEYAPFFWPWWKEPGYRRPFLNDGDREAFAKQVGSGPYGEDEPALLSPGPIDTETGLPQPLDLEQLHWRRFAIGNKTGGKLDKFKQEFPATPEEAFIASGRKVFEPTMVAMLMREVEHTDPRVPSPDNPGPVRAKLEAGGSQETVGRQGPVKIPADPKWKAAADTDFAEAAEWKLWLPLEDGVPKLDPKTGYVVGVDVSEGISESDPESGEPAYHAIEVIDHRTGIQVAEYRSRIDPILLGAQCFLAAMFFNEAWLAIEKTGPGIQVVRTVYHDFHYARTYFRKPHDRRSDEKQTDRLGWDTNRETKPILIAGAEEMLREGTTGIRSRELVTEMGSYVRAAKTAKTLPERGRFSDLLMAWMIAKQVALEKPLILPDQAGKGVFSTFRPQDSTTGY